MVEQLTGTVWALLWLVVLGVGGVVLFLDVALMMINYAPSEEEGMFPNWVKFFGAVLGGDAGGCLLLVMFLRDPEGMGFFYRYYDGQAVFVSALAVLAGAVMGVVALGVFCDWMQR